MGKAQPQPGRTQLASIPLLQPRTYKFVADEICARLLGIPPIGEYDPWEARKQNLLFSTAEGSEDDSKKKKGALKWKPPSNGQEHQTKTKK